MLVGSTKQLEEARSKFDMFDLDSSGEIEIEEFEHTIRALGLPMTQFDIEDSFKSIDTDSSDGISFEEFSHW